MEEVESEEYIGDNNFNLSEKKNNDFIISEEIPNLINTQKDPLSKYISQPYIIPSLPNTNINNRKQIQYVSKNRLNLYLINQNLQQHNSTPGMKDLMIINNLISSKETHFTSLFKDYLISDYKEEFLKGYFNIDQCTEVIPQFYDYYKNYLHFFCKGTFTSFEINSMIQEYGENQAQIYYNINYRKKERNKNKDNTNEKNIDDIDDSGNNSNYNDSKKIDLVSFFTKSVENSIKKIKTSYEKKILSKKDKELSNIKPLKNSNKENTINLPDNSTVSTDDLITKKSSIINIIDLMNKKDKNKKSNMNKKKKMEIILIDNKKIKKKRNIITNNKHINSFSKTISKLKENSLNKIKDIKNKTKKSISKNKGNNIKINNVVSKKNIIFSSSNYIKYIDILKTKKNNKNNMPGIKKSKYKLVLSTTRNLKNKKYFDNIPSLNINDNINNFILLSNNNISNNHKGSKTKNSNKINSSKKTKYFYQKIKIANNSSLLNPLSTSRKKINKNIINKKSEPKDKSKTKIINTNNNFYYKKNTSNHSKILKGISFSPRSNYTHNKSLSNSTVNNCNININNNIILSNNFFGHKNMFFQQKMNNSGKKFTSKNLIPKKYKINHNSRSITSRNIKIDLEKFKTDENIVNSIILHSSNNKLSKIKISENAIQIPSFRKSNNYEKLIKQRTLFKLKKYNININNKKNLTQKDIPAMYNTRSILNKNNSSKKIRINGEFSYNNKTHKNLYLKSINNNQKKIIFDYKKK